MKYADMNAEEVCRDIYRETQAFYAEKVLELGSRAYGFRILYGPPIFNAPILFLGYQPGGNIKDAEIGVASGEQTGWPPCCDYAVANWRLAKRMQEVLSVPLLKRCTGLNAIFFRSPNIRTWKNIPSLLHKEVEEFSLTRARIIVETLRPQLIVVVGIGTFDRLTSGVATLTGNQRTLAKRGVLWGAPACGIIHLSGAQIARNDVSRLKGYLAGIAPT